MVWKARNALPDLWQQGAESRGTWDDESALADTILEDDPQATLDALKHAVSSGASAEQLGSVVAYAAFLRMARFHTSNEFGDWDTVHNTLTAANALHQALIRAPSVELIRAIFDTAISIYLDRFLNTPAQRIPEPNGAPPNGDLGPKILDAMNSQQQVEQTARLVTDYVASAAAPEGILPVLAHAMLREDSTFHHFQIVDAALKQYENRRGGDDARHVLVGCPGSWQRTIPRPGPSTRPTTSRSAYTAAMRYSERSSEDSITPSKVELSAYLILPRVPPYPSAPCDVVSCEHSHDDDTGKQTPQ